MIVGANPLLLKKRGGTDWEAAVNSLSPTAWWRLGETSGTDALDENGLYDGTYINSPSLNQSSLISGDPNPSIRLDGASELVSFGDVLNPGTSDFSVVIWVNPDANVSQRPIQKRGTGGFGTQAGWQLGMANLSGNFTSNSGVEAGNGAYSAIGSSELPSFGINIGSSYMITMTFSNSNERLRIYRDSTLLATGTVTGSLAGESVTTTRPLTIGCADNGGGTRSQYWDGFLDEGLFFLGTELTSGEISDLYTAGS